MVAITVVGATKHDFQTGKLVNIAVAQFGSVFVVYFMEPPTANYTDLLRNDNAVDVRFRREMIARGIFMMPLPLKRNHLTAAHTEQDMAKTLEAAEVVFRKLGGN
jgi:glutamate-1-semialdehyde 2,1-aminomutase